MDITEIRHRNLLYLLDEILARRGITKNKDASQALGGLGDSYLSQLKSGKKMGDDTARRIEQGMHLKHGCMDSPMWSRSAGVAEPTAAYGNDAQHTLTPRERALLENYRAADENTKKVVDAAASAGAQSGRLKTAR